MVGETASPDGIKEAERSKSIDITLSKIKRVSAPESVAARSRPVALLPSPQCAYVGSTR